jgi:RNA polymerase sigma-70 factor (ECF subfamily)
VYCVIPGTLAGELHTALEDHFADDPAIELIVERRDGERRGGADRRLADRNPAGSERRVVRARAGRRVADRRAGMRAVDPPRLPSVAEPHRRSLLFVEREQPTELRVEDIDTARLVARLQAGERELFTELYLRYYARVYSYARMTLRDAAEAEDLAQEVFLRVFEAVPRWERRDVPFRAWLFRIMRHAMVDRLRERRRLDVRPPEDINRARDEFAASHEGDALLALDEREWLRQLRQLPEPEQQVIVLRYILELSPREIGGLMERSPESIRQLQQRALWVLRERLVVRPSGRRLASGPR